MGTSITLAKGLGQSPSESPSTVISSRESKFKGGGTSIRYGKEFVCGWGAALINILVTFPVNKIMFRQMVHGISTTTAIIQLKNEGLHKLYRGLLPPLCQKTTSVSIMFGMYGHFCSLFEELYPSMPGGIQLAMAATLAGCTEALLCPFERVQTVLQDKKFYGMYKNTIHVTKELRKFGVQEYYRGMSLVMLRNGPSNILFFYLRKKIKDASPDFGHTYGVPFLVDFASGAFLGALISTVMYPVNVLKTHQQCQVGGPYISIKGAFLEVYNSRGRRISGLFKGVHVNYSRALISWGIINASYEMLLKLFYR